MRQRIISLAKHPLISGSSIMFFGTFLGNVFNYIFTLIIGRYLFPSDYGVYSVLSSIVVLFLIFQDSFSAVFAKFAAKYSVDNDKVGINAIFWSGFKIIIIFCLLLFILLISSIQFASSFLHIKDISFLILTYLAIFFFIASSLPFGILRGELRFIPLAIFNISGGLAKVIIGFTLLILGFKLPGVMYAFFLSIFLQSSYLFFFVFTDVKKYASKALSETNYLADFKKNSLQFFLATFGISILSTGDVILAKHFFNPVLAGQYAALAIMGKAILYLTAPIYYVFFPLIARKKEKKEKLLGTLMLAAGIISLCSAGLSLVYFLFPGLVLKLFFPSPAYQYLKPYIGIYSLYILIFSLANLFNNYFLSIGKSKIYLINLCCSVVFIVGFFAFHNSISQLIIVLFTSSVLLLISYLLMLKIIKV